MIYLSTFLGGVLSFFSPCVLPVIPLYIGYLSGGNLQNRKRIIVNTIFFTIGISFAFFILSLGFSSLEKERKFFVEIDTMNPIIAFLLGFTFSFAWTPCIGPALSSVLFTITALKDIKVGYTLMAMYTLGLQFLFYLQEYLVHTF